MKVKGTVENIVYYNASNGYTVLVLKVDKHAMSVVGNLPAMSVGEIIEVEGNMQEHAKYGEQLLVNSYTVHAPKSKEAVIKYLSSGLIKGVGEIIAGRIFDQFGENTMDIIENKPSLLSRVRGISSGKAQDISTNYSKIKSMQTQIMFLQQYNITINTAIKIYNVYGNTTIDTVKQNPYQLIDDVEGIGFITADRIAQSMGISIDSPFRIRASVIYCLRDSAEKTGNTYEKLSDLSYTAGQLLKLDLLDQYSQLFDDIIGRLVLDVTVRVFDNNDDKCIALSRFYNTEKAIASKLVALNHSNTTREDYQPLIEDFERVNKIKFHLSQAQAVSSALKNGVTVITGGPGTGKTTIVNCICSIYASQGKKVELCAPTGRASKRLAQSTGLPAKTIHRLLGISSNGNTLNFTYNQYNNLPADVVIVDEVSMVDCMIMNSLLKSLANDTRLILVGDKDQLPSVGAGNVLADIIKSDVCDVKYLTHIFRQEQDSLIITNAHLINSCKMPIINNTNKDFFIINKQSGEEVFDEVCQLITNRLPQWTSVPANQIQLLGALKNGICGVNNCNTTLQKLLNPHTLSKQEYKLGDTIFREGDKVMQIVNDYDMEWTRIGQFGVIESGSGVFNGDIGYIKSIDKLNGSIKVVFDDDKEAEYLALDLYNLQLAYAITIHKSQGSEFDVIVVPIVSGPPTILNKNLLYTAVTRAKKVVVLVCNKRVLNMVVSNNYIALRNTLLADFLISEDSKYGKYVQ
ncbi:MAG: ATP-dependent RecD-like DNA helicase [Clostridia bacterium]|nr:ATP-dependent RecD-like DNA helicase [Clostridia bacterium]